MIRYAICNETFVGWEHARICRFIANLGYRGLEIAPFTLAPRITDVSAHERNQLRLEAECVDLEIIGLHWLLAKTEGLHLTSPEKSIRANTGAYLGELARCCKDLGGWVLVLGSPLQRNLAAGMSFDEGLKLAADTISSMLPVLEECGVTLAIEPLGPVETNFLNTATEGVALIEKLAHPNVKLHLDVKAMSTEKSPITDVIRDHASWMVHFHANDPNKRGPGFGEVDFVPIFKSLTEIRYGGWVSVEVFDYSPDPETIARQSLEYMKKCAAKASP